MVLRLSNDVANAEIKMICDYVRDEHSMVLQLCPKMWTKLGFGPDRRNKYALRSDRLKPNHKRGRPKNSIAAFMVSRRTSVEELLPDDRGRHSICNTVRIAFNGGKDFWTETHAEEVRFNTKKSTLSALAIISSSSAFLTSALRE